MRRTLLAALSAALFSISAQASEIASFPFALGATRATVAATVPLAAAAGLSQYTPGVVVAALSPEKHDSGLEQATFIFDGEDRLAGVSLAYTANKRGVTLALARAGYELRPDIQEAFAPGSAWLSNADTLVELSAPAGRGAIRVTYFSAKMWAAYRAQALSDRARSRE